MPRKDKDRYGLTGQEVMRLRYQWTKIITDCEWDEFNTFVYWASISGYEHGKQLIKNNPDQPHGHYNSRWVTKEELSRIKQEADDKKTVLDNSCDLCRECTRECPHNGNGCVAWREWFVENWNKNIHSRKSEEVPDRPVFRYAHPDMIREGNV